MPKKRTKSFKPSSSTHSASSSASATTGKQTRGVNELLANLRRSSAGPSSQQQLPANTPSVPPAIREILQIPETPPPPPRRPVRPRYDQHGRRLPPGPPPPRSWVSRGDSRELELRRGLQALKLDSHETFAGPMPDTSLPGSHSLIGIILQKIALDWDSHCIYNHYHLFFVPGHLKPCLIRLLSVFGEDGIAIADLRRLLLPPEDIRNELEEMDVSLANEGVTYLDLAGSLGNRLRLKEVTDLLFSAKAETIEASLGDTEESWETSNLSFSPPRVLLPNLTHLSLALKPKQRGEVSWKHLISLSSKLRGITHLSLAHWPTPCFTPRARTSLVTSPQGQTLAYGGTTLYSHSIDQDWSEALLVLRMLSKNMYLLEFLDLTGCSSWFEALMARSEHDAVDWVGNWGKITTLRLNNGRRPGADDMPSEHESFMAAANTARRVERHIRASRAGKGRIITVERDVLD